MAENKTSTDSNTVALGAGMYCRATAIMPKVSALDSTPTYKIECRNQELREGRMCYDHIAGWLGVALTDSLIERKSVVKHGLETCHFGNIPPSHVRVIIIIETLGIVKHVTHICYLVSL